MANKFISVMETVGKDALKVWSDVVKYLPSAVSLASLIFPPAAAPLAGVVNSVDLIQQAVVTVEQKFAAAGAATGTGSQKLAQVLTMVTPTVTQLLTAEKVTVDPTFLANIVNAVVAILNVQAASAAALTPAPVPVKVA
jgi:hypothetical protein